MSDLTIDVSYIGLLSNRLSMFTKKTRNVWVCRCPICGDSKKSKYKRRFYFYLYKGRYSVKCHNCQYSTSFSSFLEEEYPDLYKSYILEKLPYKSSLKKDRFKHIKDIIPKKIILAGFDYSSLKQFSDLSPDHLARKYVYIRKIPQSKVLYCDNFSKFIESINIECYSRAYSNSKEPRMIIPFYRTDGLSTVFQARAFSKKEQLRYITIKEHEDESKIYGLNMLHKDQPVWCTEGPIDSMMIPNAIAMSGMSSALPKDIPMLRFVFDNEPRNADIIKSMRKRLLSGYNVVIFPDRMKFKDLNDMVVKGKMSSKRIIDMLEENLYTKGKGIMRLNEWSKL